MKHLYCISGLGADERIFSKLEVPDTDIHHVKWLPPGELSESIEVYADRIAQQIVHSNSIILGVSFGGMMAIEVAKRIPVSAVILLSSIKSRNELPGWMKGCGLLKLNALIPNRPISSIRPLKMIRPLENYFLGTESPEEKRIADDFRDNVDPKYLKWSLTQVLNWKNSWIPPVIYHIHGEKDRIFPIGKVRPTHTIPKAGHFMIMNRYKEINEILLSICSDIV
jgi:pimeloyl-ACP methyl ester carboxylesterase